MKIAVYAIALNEAAHVERWLQSTRESDHVIVADTGSTDDTVKSLIFNSTNLPITKVQRISIRPWRFDDARNAALALVPADVDVCIALDLDEELQPGWREAIERAWHPDTTRLNYDFDLGPDGSMVGHRIHARHAYRWAFPIHEALVPKHGITEKITLCPETLIAHKPAPARHRAYYLPMLASAVKEYPNSSRMAFYHARELMRHRRFPEAVKEFDRFLDIDEPKTEEQRTQALDYQRICRLAGVA